MYCHVVPTAAVRSHLVWKSSGKSNPKTTKCRSVKVQGCTIEEICWRWEILNEFNNILSSHFISKQFHFIIVPQDVIEGLKEHCCSVMINCWPAVGNQACLNPPAPKCQRSRYARSPIMYGMGCNSRTTVFYHFQVQFSLNLKTPISTTCPWKLGVLVLQKNCCCTLLGAYNGLFLGGERIFCRRPCQT